MARALRRPLSVVARSAIAAAGLAVGMSAAVGWSLVSSASACRRVQDVDADALVAEIRRLEAKTRALEAARRKCPTKYG
jgi:hypothetical protein